VPNPLPKRLSPHKLRHTFASLLMALGEDAGYVMDQPGHTDAGFTMRVYRHGMRRDEGEKARLQCLVDGTVWAVTGSGGLFDSSEPEWNNRPEKRETPAAAGVSPEADDGTRTHDLLHGKQTL